MKIIEGIYIGQRQASRSMNIESSSMEIPISTTKF